MGIWQMEDTLAGSLGEDWNIVSKHLFSIAAGVRQIKKENADVEIHFLKIEIGDLVPTVW